jgi:hypothetical protein
MDEHLVALKEFCDEEDTSSKSALVSCWRGSTDVFTQHRQHAMEALTDTDARLAKSIDDALELVRCKSIIAWVASCMTTMPTRAVFPCCCTDHAAVCGCTVAGSIVRHAAARTCHPSMTEDAAFMPALAACVGTCTQYTQPANWQPHSSCCCRTAVPP